MFCKVFNHFQKVKLMVETDIIWYQLEHEMNHPEEDCWSEDRVIWDMCYPRNLPAPAQPATTRIKWACWRYNLSIMMSDLCLWMWMTAVVHFAQLYLYVLPNMCDTSNVFHWRRFINIMNMKSLRECFMRRFKRNGVKIYSTKWRW